MDCIFCKIIDKQIPAQIIYEDNKVLAFEDISPKAPHHKIIIPRKHIATLNDLQEEDEALIGHLVLTVTKIARELGIAEEGYRLVVNCNKGGGQTVFHIHAHLLGGRDLTWPPG